MTSIAITKRKTRQRILPGVRVQLPETFIFDCIFAGQKPAVGPRADLAHHPTVVVRTALELQ
jgi:hypothetical protein